MSRGQRQQMAAMDRMGLDSDDALQYALMLSREEGEGEASGHAEAGPSLPPRDPEADEADEADEAVRRVAEFARREEQEVQEALELVRLAQE